MKIIQRIECGGCGRFFVGTVLFDKHRTGSYAQGQRHCMTEQEMQTVGFATEVCLVRLRRGGVQQDEQHVVYYVPQLRQKLVAHIAVLRSAEKKRVVVAE